MLANRSSDFTNSKKLLWYLDTLFTEATQQYIPITKETDKKMATITEVCKALIKYNKYNKTVQIIVQSFAKSHSFGVPVSLTQETQEEEKSTCGNVTSVTQERQSKHQVFCCCRINTRINTRSTNIRYM